MKKVWHGVNLMSGLKSDHSKSFANKIKKTTLEHVNHLNKFYNRLNRHDISKYVDHVKSNAFENNSHFVCMLTHGILKTKTLESRWTRWYFTENLMYV